MTDYRLPENRKVYFDALYKMNLEQRVMPGLVYLYMPALAEHYGWGAEQKLWFAFLNGMTQNPITSLRIFERLDEVPPANAKLTQFDAWFNENWETLQFDTDRRYQKRDTVEAIKAYANVVSAYGSQEYLLTRKYQELWALVRSSYKSFGRLSTFSYLEYVYLNGFGADCDDLVFEDKSGSKSHRNGMLFLLGKDELIWDKRLDNGQDGKYPEFKKMCNWLTGQADDYLKNTTVPGASRFTMESNLCTFKNHFFGRRYPGVYADMAWERIKWAEVRNIDTELFKAIRAEHLPGWLRVECEKNPLPLKQKAAIFPLTGVPYRAEYFITGELD